MENVQRYINENDQFARHLGIEITAIEPGTATARMVLSREHINSLGMAHGGTLFTLADMAFAAASNSHGSVALGIQASIHYHRPVRSGVLTAMGRELSKGGVWPATWWRSVTKPGNWWLRSKGLCTGKRKPLDAEPGQGFGHSSPARPP